MASNKNNIIDVRSTRSSEAFANKALLLDLDKQSQVELLNKMYQGKLKFSVINDSVYNNEVKGFVTKERIQLSFVNSDIRILELPDVSELEIGYIRYDGEKLVNNNVITLKLPKSMKSFKLDTLNMFENLVNLWVWEDTELLDFNWAGRKHVNIFIRHNGTGKVDKIAM